MLLKEPEILCFLHMGTQGRAAVLITFGGFNQVVMLYHLTGANYPLADSPAFEQLTSPDILYLPQS